jgi:hypothetical protein
MYFFQFYLQPSHLVVGTSCGPVFFETGLILKTTEAAEGVRFEHAKAGAVAALQRCVGWLGASGSQDELRRTTKLLGSTESLTEEGAVALPKGWNRL